MGRKRWSRVVAAVAVLVGIAVTSGCVVFGTGSIAQQQTVGSVQLNFTICASGTVTGSCADTGASGSNAGTGTGQVLVGILVPTSVGLPASFTSTGPETLAFSDSPSYAAELQRLAPASAGTRWVGYLSAVTNYSNTSGPQTAPVTLSLVLGQGAGGSPFAGPLTTVVVLGGRQVTADAPGTRPVTCPGPTLTSVFVENPSTPAVALGICRDSASSSTIPTRDLGILSGATGSGGPGGLASIPFALRYAGTATATANFSLTATTTLPNATVAVTPGALVPASDSDNQALVAVGIPTAARPGTYDVTLTAKLANGQTRTRTGKLTVTGGGGGGGGTTGGTVKLKLTTVLPRGLSVVAARRSGIAVLIGANKTGTARVQLFQGTGTKNKKPKASKSVRLRVPGPTRVVLRSKKLKVGPYRVVIKADGRTFVRRATLKK